MGCRGARRGYTNLGHLGTWANGELGPLGTRDTCYIATVPSGYLYPHATNRCPWAQIHYKKNALGDEEPLSYSNSTNSPALNVFAIVIVFDSSIYTMISKVHLSLVFGPTDFVYL